MIEGRRVALSLLALAALVLGGCSDVGPGLKNHPADCALGIPWADCLPGTPGYANGGGRVHREAAAKEQAAAAERVAAMAAMCQADYETPELDPIRHKVELFRASFDDPVPFEMATNDTFPTEEERAAIAKWATLREGCMKKSATLNAIPPNATPLQVTFMQQDQSFMREASAKVGDLIVALYQQKLTYGEFAKKRYEITRDAAAAERQFRESALIADHDRQVQAQQLAQQQFQNNLAAWAAYTQAVSARQPQTVHLDGSVRLQSNCLSQRFGNTVTTNCN